MRSLRVIAPALLVIACAQPVVARPVSPPPRAPEVPDYADLASWAARPEVEDAADVVPPGEADQQAGAMVDAFFVHPTTHYGRAPNAAVDDARAAPLVDALVLPHQASVFNAAGRVFAPRYRQATVWTFTTRRDFEEAERAMELAYSDVLAAFDAWARESDRPVIIAGHSQGSYHALRLLAERFEGDDAMRARLVAAYLVGMPVPMDVFSRTIPSIPLCEGPEATGCVLTWNTVLEGARPRRLSRRQPVHYPGARAWETTAGKTIACTNPIGATDGWTAREQHLGAVLFVDSALRPVEPRIEPALTRARCIDGVLEIERDVPFRYRSDPLSRDGDLHLADYPLFYLDIRRDAVRRVEAWSR